MQDKQTENKTVNWCEFTRCHPVEIFCHHNVQTGHMFNSVTLHTITDWCFQVGSFWSNILIIFFVIVIYSRLPVYSQLYRFMLHQHHVQWNISRCVSRRLLLLLLHLALSFLLLFVEFYKIISVVFKQTALLILFHSLLSYRLIANSCCYISLCLNFSITCWHFFSWIFFCDFLSGFVLEVFLLLFSLFKSNFFAF